MLSLLYINAIVYYSSPLYIFFVYFFFFFLFIFMLLIFFFFFFQAEDGIRDLTVTGVQTCALPIYPRPARRAPGRRPGHRLRARGGRGTRLSRPGDVGLRATQHLSQATGLDGDEIGRASCRERV